MLGAPPHPTSTKPNWDEEFVIPVPERTIGPRAADLHPTHGTANASPTALPLSSSTEIALLTPPPPTAAGCFRCGRKCGKLQKRPFCPDDLRTPGGGSCLGGGAGFHWGKTPQKRPLEVSSNRLGNKLPSFVVLGKVYLMHCKRCVKQVIGLIMWEISFLLGSVGGQASQDASQPQLPQPSRWVKSHWLGPVGDESAAAAASVPHAGHRAVTTDLF